VGKYPVEKQGENAVLQEMDRLYGGGVLEPKRQVDDEPSYPEELGIAGK
jgi:hypothetical protein